MYSLVVFVVILLLLLYIYSSSGASIEPFVAPEARHILPKVHKDAIINSLEVIHNMFLEHNIFYCIESGTLLGSVRHKDMIPWDDDGDIMVWLNDKERIMALRTKFHLAGMDLKDKVPGNNRLLRVYCVKGKAFPFIDLILYKQIGDAVPRCLPRKSEEYNYIVECPAGCCQPTKDNPNMKWWWTFEYKAADLLPLKLYSFNRLKLWGPNNPEPFLRSWYGDDYMTSYKVTHNHTGQAL